MVCYFVLDQLDIRVNNEQPVLDSGEANSSFPEDPHKACKYSLAISGDIFRWILDYENETVVKRVSMHPRLGNTKLTLVFSTFMI